MKADLSSQMNKQGVSIALSKSVILDAIKYLVWSIRLMWSIWSASHKLFLWEVFIYDLIAVHEFGTLS